MSSASSLSLIFDFVKITSSVCVSPFFLGKEKISLLLRKYGAKYQVSITANALLILCGEHVECQMITLLSQGDWKM